jgi:hypothetical protein
VTRAPLTIAWIRERVARNEYLVTLHADQEPRNDLLSIFDIEAALRDGEMIEEYPEILAGLAAWCTGAARAETSTWCAAGTEAAGW